MSASTDLRETGNLPGERPYQERDAAADQLRGKVGMGRSQAGVDDLAGKKPQSKPPPGGGQEEGGDVPPSSPPSDQPTDTPPGQQELGISRAHVDEILAKARAKRVTAPPAQWQYPLSIRGRFGAPGPSPTLLNETRPPDRTGHGVPRDDYLAIYGPEIPKTVFRELSELYRVFTSGSLVTGLYGDIATDMDPSKTTMNDVTGQTLAVIGTPFTLAAEETNIDVVERDPLLKAKYDREMAGLPEKDRGDFGRRGEAAGRAIDSHVTELSQLLDREDISDSDKLAVFSEASLLITQRVIQLGGPWALHWLRKIGFQAAKGALKPGEVAHAAGPEDTPKGVPGSTPEFQAKVDAGKDLTKDPKRAASDTADAAAGKVPTGGDVSTTPPQNPLVGKGVDVIGPLSSKRGVVLSVPKDHPGYIEVLFDDGSTQITNAFELRTSALDDEIAAARMDNASRKSGTTTVTTKEVRGETTLSAEDRAKYGVLGQSVRNEEIWNATGVDTSTIPPEQYDTFVTNILASIKRNPDAYSFANRQHMSNPEILGYTAKYLGQTTSDLGAQLRSRFGVSGDLGGLLHAVNIRMLELFDDVSRLRASNSTPSEIAKAEIEFHQFAGLVGGANSDAGRTLYSLQLQRDTGMVQALTQKNVVVSVTSRVKAAEKELEKIKRKKPQTFDEKVQRSWENEVNRAQKSLDDLKHQRDIETQKHIAQGETAKIEAYLKALRDRPESPELAEGIMAMDPGDPASIAQAMMRLKQYSRGEKYIQAVMSGIYSGLGGHGRSAAGALVRVVDDLWTGAVGEVLQAPFHAGGADTAFARGETKARIFGAIESLRTLPHMWHDLMVYDINPEMLSKAEGFEGIRGSPFTGKARALDFMVRMHGLYHATAWHMINQMEINALIVRESARTGTAIHDLQKSVPEHLVKVAAKTASDSSYLESQGALEQAIMKVVGWAPTFNQLPVIGPRFGSWLGPTPVVRPLFVAARFGFGILARGTEYSGGGLLRASALIQEAGSVHDKELEILIRATAATDIGHAGDPRALAQRIKDLRAHPPKRLVDQAKEATQGENLFARREASRAAARGLFGVGMLTWGFAAFESGDLIGKDPLGKGRDDTLLIDVGGHKSRISLRWFFPFSTPLIFAARINDGFKDSLKSGGDFDATPHVGEAVKAIANQWIDGDSLSVIGTLINYTQGRDTKGGERVLAQYAAHMALPSVSAMMRDLDRMIGGAVKDPHGFWEYAAAQLPIAREALRNKLGPLGDVIHDKGPYDIVRETEDEDALGNPNDPLMKWSEMMAHVPGSNWKKFPKVATEFNIGKPDDHIKLSNQEAWELRAATGVTRRKMLTELTRSFAFQKAKPEEQLKMWHKEVVAADRVAKRDYSIQLALHGNPRFMDKYAFEAVTSVGTSKRTRALWVGSLAASGQLTPPVEAALGRAFAKHDVKAPSMADMKRAAPVVRQFLAAPPFTRGNPGEWKELEVAKTEHNRLAQQDRRDGTHTAEAFMHSRGGMLINRYADRELHNQTRVRLLARYPWLKEYVHMTLYTPEGGSA
jgi:hypothetical protein